jgi:hypothetical protein
MKTWRFFIHARFTSNIDSSRIFLSIYSVHLIISPINIDVKQLKMSFYPICHKSDRLDHIYEFSENYYMLKLHRRNLLTTLKFLHIRSSKI